MNPEEPIQTQLEEPQTVETGTTEPVSGDDPLLVEMKSMNETLAWSISFQVAIMSILLINLFFTALKAGKS